MVINLKKKTFVSPILIFLACALLISTLIGGWFATKALNEIARKDTIHDSRAISALLASHINCELAKIEGASRAISGSPYIPPVLASRSRKDIEAANSVLDRYNKSFDFSVSYLMDKNGVVIASSNRNEPDSFVGQSYRFRPYFQEALAGKQSRYFALGVTSGKRGFYASHPVRGEKGQITGVVVVKKDIDEIENYMKNFPNSFLVSKEGIIFLSSVPEMITKSLWPIDKEIEKAILSSKQFGEKPFENVFSQEIFAEDQLVLSGKKVIAHREVITPDGWSIFYLSPMDNILIYKTIGIVSTLFLSILIISFFAAIFAIERSRNRLRESEEKFRKISSSAQDGITMINDEGKIIFWNEAAQKIFGYSQAEAMGKIYYELLSQARYHEVSKQDFSEFQASGKGAFIGRTLPLTAVRKNGEEFPMELSASTTYLDGKLTTIGIIRDISRRKKAEDALKEVYEIVTMSSAVVFLWKNITGWPVEFVSSNVADLFGYTDEDFISGKVVYSEIIHPEDLERVAKEVSDYSTEVGRKKFIHEPYRIITKDGQTKWVEDKTFIRRDKNGNITHFQGFVEDISERIKLEEEQRIIKSQLLQAQKMESIGTLAGGIAHDFNNLLMGIQGNVSLSLLDMENGRFPTDRLKNIEDIVRSATNLTRQLLGFARGGRYEIKPTDLNELIQKTSTIFGRTAKEITISKNLQSDLWSVDVDQGQIEQVLFNLYVNAAHAMPGGGHIYIETKNEFVDESKTIPRGLPSGRYVVISHTDTGMGMDEKTKARIFEPFFTTKEMGRGTGLGLATVYGIITGHKGFIEVESEKGAGTAFRVYLPASQKQPFHEEEVSNEIQTGKETILLIDDEDMIIDVGSNMLENLGYQVLTAQNGLQAIEIYKKRIADIDLVILDMIMPEMNGSATFEALKKINPHIKVILSSGYSINGEAADLLNKGCKAFLQKPFSMATLSSRIRDALGAK